MSEQKRCEACDDAGERLPDCTTYGEDCACNEGYQSCPDCTPDAAEGEERWTIHFRGNRVAGVTGADGKGVYAEGPPDETLHDLEVVPLSRATAAEDRADASETRERVTHERAEQAESQLAHYKAEVERLLLAVEEAWRYLDDSRLSAEAASEAAHGVIDSARTSPPAEEDERG